MSTPAPAPASASGFFGALLSSPLVAFLLRETGLVIRGRGMWWKRAVYLAISGVIVAQFALLNGSGRNAFQALMALNLYSAYVLTIAVFSKSISTQREAGTLELLRITSLSPFALLVGSGSSEWLRALFLLVAQLPFALFCATLGGVSYGTIFSGYALAASVLFFYCHCALFWSVVAKSSRHAGSHTVLTGVALYALPPLIAALGRPYNLDFPAWLTAAASWVAEQNPFTAFKAIVSGRSWPWASALFHAGFGAAFLWAAVRRFEPACERLEQTAALTVRPGFTQKARRRPVPRVQGRPLTWKEFHFAAGGARGQQLRWFGYLVLLALVFWATRDLPFSLFLIGISGLFIELPLAWTKIIGAEVQQRTIGDLGTLPIPPWQMVRDKALGHLPILLPSLCLTVTGLLFNAAKWGDFVPQGAFWMILGYVLFQYAFHFVLTIYLSLTQPTNAYGTSFVFLLLANSLLLGLLAKLQVPLPIMLLIPTLLSAWLMLVLIRVFPITFYATAAK